MLNELGRRFLMLFRRGQFDSDLDEEMRLHRELREQEEIERGLSAKEAHYAAQRRFGNDLVLREESRDMWGWNWLEDLLKDIRYGLRMLVKNPGFTAVAVLTLALGIGANTAVFSMVNGIILRALPFYQPQNLYVINEVVPQWSQYAPWFAVNSGNFLLWQRECPGFSAMALILPRKYNLTGRGFPRQVYAASVSADFFAMMGIQPRLGRTFLPAEAKPGANHEAILTEQFWRQAFDADSGIIGQAITLDDAPYTIVGIAPESFRFPEVLGSIPELFTPAALAGYDLDPGIGNFNYTVIARLKDGVSSRQALAQVDVVESRVARQGDAVRGHAPGQYDLRARLTPLKTFIAGPAGMALWTLEVAAAFVLLIVCVNLANLLLARDSARGREMAVRTALGATTGRLARQFLTEGFTLAATGGALGLFFAAWGVRILVRHAPPGIPRLDSIRIDPRVLLFALGVSVLAALLFALLPALRLARVGPLEALKSAGPGASGARASVRLRGSLVVAEIALCGMLLAGALLLIESLIRVTQANQWMEEQRVLALNLFMLPTRARTVADRYRFYTDVLRKVQALPGVASAAFTGNLPLLGHVWGDDINFREAPRPPSKTEVGGFYFVSPGYFNTIQLPLVEGRTFSESDQGNDVAIISESIARRLLPGRNPVGMNLLWSPNEPPKARRIIGVVGDVRSTAEEEAALVVYVPIWSFSQMNEVLVVRTAMDPRGAAAEIRRAVWSVDPEVAIPRERTLKTIVQTSEAPRRYATLLGGLFALCAVLIAALGLYGVVSYSAAQRSHEIGIRIALGAEKGDVLKMVVGQGFKLALAGVGIGIVGALALAHFLASLLFRVKPSAPLTFVAVSLILTAVALLASYIPARRATKVDPIVALRYE